MSEYLINGRRRLSGEIKVQGAKNSALPILAATVLCRGVNVIHNCPRLTDVEATVNILSYLGCTVTRDGDDMFVDSTGINRFDIPDNLMREMRSSIIFLGAILGRLGKAELSMPGGCEIGLRPIDLHIEAVKKLGAQMSEDSGRAYFECPEGLSGSEISLSFPSVGATENIILAACTAKGTTTLFNAAREPEISDLCDFLNRSGARISGAGCGEITIHGVEALHASEHTVIPDRIAAVTYLAAAAVTGGKITLSNVIPGHISHVIPIFRDVGCDVNIRGKSIHLTSPVRLKAVKQLRTMPYPGFPTDMQAPVMAMLTVAEGTSVIIETIFESRFKHVPGLVRMGAKIHVDGRVAVVEGVETLSGASVSAPDLRAGSALVIAALAAESSSTVGGIHHIDRGYENFSGCLQLLGADIIRMDDNE